MSAEEVNWCPCLQDKNKGTETGADGNNTFDFLLPSEIKCENEQTDLTCHKLPHFDYCCEETSSPVPIKTEPKGEDSKYDLQLQGENVVLKEEIDIKEHKPRWELIRGTSGAGLFADGIGRQNENDFVEEGKCKPSGSKSAELVAKYNCAHCPYNTNNRHYFINHYNRVHKQCAEVYRCDDCSYKTRYKHHLISHHRIKHSKDPQVHKCDECSFETKYKYALTRHYKSEHSQVYKCEEYSFETRGSGNFTRHSRIKHSKEGEVFKCEECSYETRDKCNFTRHHKMKHSKEWIVYKCDQCSYETKYKCALTKHFKRKHFKEAECINVSNVLLK